MTEALQYIYYAYGKLVTFLFSEMEIVSGVTFGWVMLSIIVFGILVASILNLPKGVHKVKNG